MKKKLKKPFQDALPVLSTAEFDALRADIKQNGVRDPVIVDEDGVVLDGHHRLKIDPQAPRRVVKGLSPAEKEAFVFRSNFVRRNMSADQKREAHQRMKDVAAKLRAEDPKKWTQAKVAVALGVDRSTVTKWMDTTNVKIHKGCTPDARVTVPRQLWPDIARQVDSGRPQAQVASDYGVTQQRVSAIVREAAKEKKRKREREANEKKVATAKGPPTGAVYSTIVIDPPWDYKEEGDNDVFGRTRPRYAQMADDQIAELPVGKLAAKDAHLYLWITNRSLLKGKGWSLPEAWGFRPVTVVTWCKPSIGVGNYFRNNTEHIVFAVRGSLSLKRRDLPTWFEWERGKKGHSSKPAAFYPFVESASPGPYLEMFSRETREGWVAWGEDS